MVELRLSCCAAHRILLLGPDYNGDTNCLCCRRALQLCALADKGSLCAEGLHCHSHDNSRKFEGTVCQEAVSLRLSDVLLLCLPHPQAILPIKSA